MENKAESGKMKPTSSQFRLLQLTMEMKTAAGKPAAVKDRC
jgi:hypothetical protein